MPNEGQIAINKKTGARAVFRNGVWVAEKAAPPEAALRGRLSMGVGPMVQAQERMTQAEAGGNPLQRDWGAEIASNIGVGGWKPLEQLGRMWGGQDYQDYTQAAKQFESQLMPIMSGAAVSESEAQRQIRASLPELGDTPETLKEKAAARQMMLNGAASLMGVPLPYPKVPTYGVNTTQTAPAAKTRDQKNQELKAKSAAKASGGFKILGVEN